MVEFDGRLPILGQDQQKPRATANLIVSLVRSMDENGTFEPEATYLSGGQVQAIAGRSNICSAEDLCDMICDMIIPQVKIAVREEIKKALENR